MSSAVVTTQNMELTPMRVKFKGRDLGGTLGNVTVKIEFKKAEIKADQSGETVRDRRVSAIDISIETELAEINLKDNWKVVFPAAQLVNDGIGNKMIYVTNNIGHADLSDAGPLVLHPLSKADADLSGDFTFFLAVADSKSSVVYGPKEQAKLKINWMVLPDTSVQPEQFMIYGDPSIGVVPAAHGSAVAGSNTGTGTVGSISVFSGVTKTETITLLCIEAGAGPAAIFQVSGNLSGPLGNAATGTGFSSPVIAFTVTEGGTAFVPGDSFTIATTAANYI